jgi:glycosyltransferase involved in cell wall biosynthesis
MRIFSGIQPTGAKHLGNYAGGFRQYAATQEQGEAFFCIVDLHSISVRYDPEDLRERTLDLLAMLVATGLDPDRSTIFAQSHVSAHAEANWLLSTVTSFGELRRMTNPQAATVEEPQLAERLRVDDVVRFMGPTTDIPSMLQRAAIFALTSQKEVWPAILGEAMACGVPCVSYEMCPSIAEIITDNEDGLIVPLLDGPAFTDALRKLMGEGGLCRAMAENARRSVLRFSPNLITHQWEQHFEYLER